MENEGHEGGLHRQIFIAMATGLIVGLGLNFFADKEAGWFTTLIWWFDLFGKEIFIGGLKMIIAPLIFASIVAGVSSLPGTSELGNIGAKTLGYYFCTTAIAVAIGVAAVMLIQPGTKDASQAVREQREAVIEKYQAEYAADHGPDTGDSHYRAGLLTYMASRDGEDAASGSFQTNWARMADAKDKTAADMFLQDILRPVMTNPFNALAQKTPNALGVIFFAMLTGIACIVLGESARPVTTFFQSFNQIMMTITLWLMKLAPLAIGCLIASIVGTLGIESLQSLAWYCLAVIVGIALHIAVLLLIVSVLGRMSPLVFIRGIRDAWLIAFSTTSSAATLPVTIHCVTKKLNVSPKVANFSLPVGATVNMDGTALYEGVAVIFLIQMYGGLLDVPIELTSMKAFTIFITAVFASIGAAAVPSAGLITMAIVASAVGLPLHYIVMIYAVDRMLDMFRTSTNVLGDAAGAVVVDHWERGRLEAEQRAPATDPAGPV